MLTLKIVPVAFLLSQACCMDVEIWDNKDCHGGTNWYCFFP
jgi:hypothetical protein